MKYLFTVVVLVYILSCANHSIGQGLSINTSGAAADTSAMLDVASTTKGILVPRMDSTQRMSIYAPATGLLVYQTNGVTPGFYYYNGSAWAALAGGSGSGSSAGWATSGANIYNSNTGNVGIGLSTPRALLQVADSSVAFSASGDVPAVATNTPLTGAGRRMMWYPQKAAFRAGYTSNTNWDNTNIGKYSAAFGRSTQASGIYSFAAGDSAYATGNSAVAMGGGDPSWGWTFANGDYTVAMGYATFCGSLTTPAPYSASIGAYHVSQGLGSYSFGMDAVAFADSSMALGFNVYAQHKGSCVMGDENGNWSGAITYSSAKNQMTMRYTGGYRLFTNWTGSSSTIGVSLAAGGNSWSTISDRNRKTNFALVDGEEVLRKLNGFEMTTWNYKEQEPENFRHYGPMAQDFFAAFGHDKYGTIGNDSTIGQSDLEGLSLVAIQALVKRTDAQAAEIKDIRKAGINNSELNNSATIASLQSKNDDLEKKIAELQRQINDLIAITKKQR
jgi:hypothetical protein